MRNVRFIIIKQSSCDFFNDEIDDEIWLRIKHYKVLRSNLELRRQTKDKFSQYGFYDAIDMVLNKILQVIRFYETKDQPNRKT